MSVPSFGDFGKDASDLVTKGFFTDGFKFITETRTANGINLKTTTSQGPKGVSLTTEPDYKWDTSKVNVKGKLSTDNTTEGSIGFSDLGGVQGLKLEAGHKQDVKLARSLYGSFTFTNKLVNSKATITVPSGKTKGELELAVQYPPQVSWGVNLKYEHAEKPADRTFNWNGRVQLNKDNFTFGVALYDGTTSTLTNFSSQRQQT
eukprot:TRINITY_DN36_c0_g2_i6.p1 TRINITY_DN36_c0_g2~~TRINITY_DN36_c0_g2_i6.p1  ORF type:complete len:204 (-),score=29.70 TRINITY_DN36_c0_g2_i6:476-1087(-)